MQTKTILPILAAAVLSLALATGCTTRGGGDQAESGASGGESAVSAESGGGEAVAPATDESAARPVSQTLPGLGPKVIQTASLRLSVREGRFDEALDEARSLASSLGGFVVGSSSTQGASRRLERGTLVIRVPARSYADAMKRLSGLGRVEGRDESGQDVSQEFVDLEARARHLEAVERQLLQLLTRADDVAAALAVQSKLNEVQLDLEQTRGRLGYLEEQVSFATISLALHERRAGKPGGGDDGWGIVDAWETAGRGFLAVVGWTFVVLATAAPVLLLLALVWLLARNAMRRWIAEAWPRPRNG